MYIFCSGKQLRSFTEDSMSFRRHCRRFDIVTACADPAINRARHLSVLVSQISLRATIHFCDIEPLIDNLRCAPATVTWQMAKTLVSVLHARTLGGVA
jgi:hypothetical protein